MFGATTFLIVVILVISFVVEGDSRCRLLLFVGHMMIVILVYFIAVEELKSTLLRQRDITK